MRSQAAVYATPLYLGCRSKSGVSVACIRIEVPYRAELPQSFTPRIAKRQNSIPSTAVGLHRPAGEVHLRKTGSDVVHTFTERGYICRVQRSRFRMPFSRCKKGIWSFCAWLLGKRQNRNPTAYSFDRVRCISPPSSFTDFRSWIPYSSKIPLWFCFEKRWHLRWRLQDFFQRFECKFICKCINCTGNLKDFPSTFRFSSKHVDRSVVHVFACPVRTEWRVTWWRLPPHITLSVIIK